MLLFFTFVFHIVFNVVFVLVLDVVGCCVVKPDKKIKLKCCRVYEFLFLTFLTFKLVLDLFLIFSEWETHCCLSRKFLVRLRDAATFYTR